MEVTLNGITKNFKDKLAVDNFTIKLTNGVYGLLGPNGSGKTTLMRIIADVMTPTKGCIKVNGVKRQIMGREYRELLGYLPQDLGFYNNWTGEKFLFYVAALKGIDKKEAKEKIDNMLEYVNLNEYRKKKIGKYSGGMKQRLGIAQALLNDPKILILDEPTSGLDPNERIRLKNLLSSLSKDMTILLSTHIASDIEYIANRILIMKDGQLIDHGNVQHVLATAKGKVWHCNVLESLLFDLQNRFNVVNILRQGDRVLLRIISDTKPVENAKSEDLHLDDVFIYYFNDRKSTYQEVNYA